MTDDRKAIDKLASGYDNGTTYDKADPQTQHAKRKAGAYRPEDDAEADRLKTTIGDNLPPQIRMALGYHQSAREAARQINNQED